MIETFHQVRKLSELICQPLETEDYVIQSMPDVSPPKWHLAHTTWFFEHFILSKFIKDYRPFSPLFSILFNSYYKTVGSHTPREQRGLLSRPTVKDVYHYRKVVNDRIGELYESSSPKIKKQINPLINLGIHHEQQHQELLLTDIKHIYWTNPLRPIYRREKNQPSKMSTESESFVISNRPITLKHGLYSMGHSETNFAYDHEKPKHSVFLHDFSISNRLITNGDYLEFMEAGGYMNPKLWLSEGWNCVQKYGWSSPLYWENLDHRWQIYKLTGSEPVCETEPVCHVSFYEAEAFAKWKNLRLPSEAEWEIAAASESNLGISNGNLLDDGHFHPIPAHANTMAHQLFGDVWEWTRSTYEPYPGYQEWEGSVGEYNGKFMCNQFVLRGGSCVTPRSHLRLTYRNYFTPETRWQFTGFRLAERSVLHEHSQIDSTRCARRTSPRVAQREKGNSS